jgi:hypothetical protein
MAASSRQVLALLAMAAGCARGPATQPGREALETRALAEHASEFYCELGRWPRGPAELEAFPMPERSRIQHTPSSAPIPWPLLRGAALRAEAGGALRISIQLPPDTLVDGRAETAPVDLNLEVQEPGCWPPVLLTAPSDARDG